MFLKKSLISEMKTGLCYLSANHHTFPLFHAEVWLKSLQTMLNPLEHHILIGTSTPPKCSLSHLDLSGQMLEQKKAKKLLPS